MHSNDHVLQYIQYLNRFSVACQQISENLIFFGNMHTEARLFIVINNQGW